MEQNNIYIEVAKEVSFQMKHDILVIAGRSQSMFNTVQINVSFWRSSAMWWIKYWNYKDIIKLYIRHIMNVNAIIICKYLHRNENF